MCDGMHDLWYILYFKVLYYWNIDGWMNTIWRAQEGWIWSLWLLLTHSQMPLHQTPRWRAECCSLFLCRFHPWMEKGRSDWKKEIMKGVNNLEICSLLVLSLSKYDMKKVHSFLCFLPFWSTLIFYYWSTEYFWLFMITELCLYFSPFACFV